MTALEDATESVVWLKWIDRFSVLLAALGGVATAGLMINIVLDVVGRFFFSRQLPGTVDLTQYAWMPTVVSLGLGFALLKGEHIRVNLLTAPTGPLVQRTIEVVAMVFTLGTTVLLIWFGTVKAMGATGSGEKSQGTPWLEVWPFRWVIVVGMAGLFLQAIAQLLRAITVKEFKPSEDDEVSAVLAAEKSVLDKPLNEPSTSGRKMAANGRVETP